MGNFTFTLNNGHSFLASKGGYFYSIIDGKKKRIDVATYSEAKKQHEQEVADKMHKNLDKLAKAKAPKKPRKSKDIAYTTKGLEVETTLTAKQLDFIKHIPDTSFYDGLDSMPWCDVLADEIGGQFAGKPMTVGAMISTLREKGVIYVGQDRINGRKAKYFGFTEVGRAIASELGLK